ncbi:peptide chain release factor N(5)-glutamine methyltransferase [Deferribacter thermophilus]|uniref:peptide chain release factor N(5)-glutamine methyltransferase n=1 Tax=Deferribacter thermophilus TaxID=53573 RepID=UPI003C17E9CF
MSLIVGGYYRVRDYINFLQNNFKHLSISQIKELISYIFNIKYEEIPFKMDELYIYDTDVSKVFEKIGKKYPVNYITKKRYFYGLEFYVDEAVLIPRYETEVLVEEVLKRYNKGFMLDLCTGSGCIPISIIKNSKKKIKGVGVDISINALKIARFNSIKHSVEDKLSFLNFDVLNIERLFKGGITFDFITCNPPYVDRSSNFEDSILYEPEQALFAEDEGLLFYKKLLSKLPKLCKKGGIIFFEIPWDKLDKIKEIFKDKDFEFVRDLSGKERVLIWRN